MIDCTAHWRRPNTWLCLVRHKSGELVAEHTYEGSDRREMLEQSVRIAGLLPNSELRDAVTPNSNKETDL
jgi:hypothetical protein